MRSTLAIRLVIAIGFFVLCGGRASACVLWFCEPEVYEPMRAPAQDPRLAPVWTSNGWSYPDVRLHAGVPFGPPPGTPRERRGMETGDPPLGRPIGLK
jgi:hypothetical protein